MGEDLRFAICRVDIEADECAHMDTRLGAADDVVAVDAPAMAGGATSPAASSQQTANSAGSVLDW
jgi:hypothetical protein